VRRTAAALLVALLAAAPGTSADADAADVRATISAFAQRLTVRMGVAQGSLVVLPLVGPERARLATAPCDSREKPAEPTDRRAVGRMAPLEQRKLLLVGRREESLALLQRVQALVAGLPATAQTVTEVLESKYCGDVESLYSAQLGKIPKAYAGRTVGHVAFFGYRPVEVVVFARPADYQAFGPAYLRSLAFSHAVWSELLGGAGAVSAEAEIRRLVAEGTAVVASIARVNPRTDPGVHREESRWKLFVAAAQTDIREGGHTEDFQCRFAVDETGAVVHLEAAETGSDLVFPPPYKEPGGRPVGEPPSNKGNGMGVQALQRILDRLIEARGRR